MARKRRRVSVHEGVGCIGGVGYIWVRYGGLGMRVGYGGWVVGYGGVGYRGM